MLLPLPRTASGLSLAGCAALGLCVAAAEPSDLRWSPPVVLAEGPGVQGPWRQNNSDFRYVDDAAVSLADDGTVAVVWVDQSAKDVFFATVRPDGRKPSAEGLNLSGSAETFSWLPRVQWSPDDPQRVAVLWQEIPFSGGSHGGEILFARSQDGGRTFTAPINLSNSVGGDGKGRIDAKTWHNGSLDLAYGGEGRVYACWTEYDGLLWFARSLNGGATFGKPVHLAGGGDELPARGPTLAAGRKGEVYLAWTTGEDRRSDVSWIRSSDGGATFSDRNRGANTAAYSDAPRLVLTHGGDLILFQAEGENGPFDRFEVVCSVLPAGASAFSALRPVSGSAGGPGPGMSYPAAAEAGPGEICVLVEAFPEPDARSRGLWFSHSGSAGLAFRPFQPVPGSEGARNAVNGSLQGLFGQKLAANASGQIAVVNSHFEAKRGSRVVLIRGQLPRP